LRLTHRIGYSLQIAAAGDRAFAGKPAD